SGDPDHGRSQPACARRCAGREHRGAEQAAEAGVTARAARTMAHPADDRGGIGLDRFYCSLGVPCRHCEPAIFAAAITAWVRLSTPSFCRIAETCALIVASDTPSS